MNNAVLDPLVSEFHTEGDATRHDQWFRAQVEQSMNDSRPSLPHDEAMARVQQLLEEKRKARAGT